MQITINTPEIARHTGYGRASAELVSALERAGVQVISDSNIIINFCMPKDYEYRDVTIGYTPWESTEIPKGWAEHMMRVDDLWTTSRWTAGIFKNIIKRDSYVLHHGLNETWRPKQHGPHEGPFTFLHVGEPAVRKGGDIVLEAWHKAFRKSGAKLIYKATGIPMARVKDRGGSIVYSPQHLVDEGGELITTVYSDDGMWDLFGKVDCLVYPTRGEGFGFIPLEAMASGLPTIVPNGGGTAEFALLGTPLTNFMWRTSHEVEHPGLWIDHDIEEVIESMTNVWKNHKDACDRAYLNAQTIRETFDWDNIAKKFIDRVETVQRTC